MSFINSEITPKDILTIVLGLLTTLAAWFGFALSLANFFYNRNKDKAKILVKPHLLSVTVVEEKDGKPQKEEMSTEIILEIVNKSSFPVQVRMAGLIKAKKNMARFPAEIPKRVFNRWQNDMDWPVVLDSRMEFFASIPIRFYALGDFFKAEWAFVQLSTGEVFYGHSNELKKLLKSISKGDVPKIGRVRNRSNFTVHPE
jgi:hypothetical protein